MTGKTLQPLTDYRRLPEVEMKKRAVAFYHQMRKRRTVREFSTQPVDRSVIENCLRAAATAPSGANQQPWQFVVVSNPAVKQRIRASAEKVEKDFFSKETRLCPMTPPIMRPVRQYHPNHWRG